MDSVALLQLNKFCLYLFSMCLYIIKYGLVDGESLIYLRETLCQIFVVVVYFVCEKTPFRIETSYSFVYHVKNLEFRSRVEESVIELLNFAI